MGIVNLTSQFLAYEDTPPTSNPELQIKWNRTQLQLPIPNASKRRATIGPGSSWSVFDGTRSTSIDNTTAFDLAINTAIANRYRFIWSGGTNPVLRTDRSVALSGIATTLTVQSNNTVLLTLASGTPFGSVVVGDVVFLPSTLSGDSASPFNAINVGYWSVLGATTSTLTLARPTGDLFAAYTETVTPTGNSQVQVFSAAGVQIGDRVQIDGAFATPVQRTFAVSSVTAKFFEVDSTSPMASEAAVAPGANIAFYTSAKSIVRIEVDQECALQMNGDAGTLLRLTPWVAGDDALVATFEKVGNTWKLVIVNRSTAPLHAMVLAAG